MSTIDQQFVEFIVKSLVGDPDAVAVERTIDERGVLLKLTVAEDDLGRVIGKRGSTAQSIRTLLRALGTKNDARYNLKIVDPTGGTGPSRSYDDSARDDSATAAAAPTDDDSNSTDVVETEEVKEEPVVEAPTPEPEPEKVATPNSLADKTRKELAELDDLDI